MANGTSTGTVAAVSIVVVLMVGAAFMFMFDMAMDEPDPHETTRNYTLEGTFGGEVCTGTAEAVYTPENSNFHTYTFTLDIGTSDEGRTETFGVVFGSDDLPLQSLYDRVGTDVIDGTEVEVWTIEDMGVSYTFWVTEYCVVEKARIVSSELDVTLLLTSVSRSPFSEQSLPA